MLNRKQFLITIALIIANIFIAISIQALDLWHIKNYAQSLFRFGWFGLLIFFIFGYWIIIKLKIHFKYPLFLSIILAGVFSNIIEKLYFGYVVDYINFGIGVVNFADIQIYLCCVYIFINEIFKDLKSN